MSADTQMLSEFVFNPYALALQGGGATSFQALSPRGEGRVRGAS